MAHKAEDPEGYDPTKINVTFMVLVNDTPVVSETSEFSKSQVSEFETLDEFALGAAHALFTEAEQPIADAVKLEMRR